MCSFCEDFDVCLDDEVDEDIESCDVDPGECGVVRRSRRHLPRERKRSSIPGGREALASELPFM